MCFQQIPVLLRRRRTWRPTRGRHVSHLRTLTQTTLSPAFFSLALWNCQSAVNKADFIPAFATQSAVHLLALTLRQFFILSHSSLIRPGGGTGLLINDTWKFSSTAPLSNLCSLEYHAVRITAPIAVQVTVIYRPPGQLGNFCGELDMLLSHFPEDATPLIVMGDLNIHLDKPHAADVFALLNTFDLSLVSTPPTHKAGNNLILTRNCTTDNILVTPLHVSDHFFIQLTVFIPRPSQSPPTLVTFWRNLRSLNPDRFSSLVSARTSPSAIQMQSQTQTSPLGSHLLIRGSLTGSVNNAPRSGVLRGTVAPALMPAITQVINTSLKTGTFPTSFKQALITPLLKKPSLDPSVVENYRPVSLLPFLAKTIERAVFNQLSDFLSKNNLLDVKQSGFKRGHSTETALLTVVEYLRAAKATGQSSVLILLDLSSAFDTVNHQILLSTLSDLGISGSALVWLRSYLSGRTFKVSWRRHLSNSHSLSTGVPQGSVLGPLLFSIYTSSLGAIIHSHGLSYHCYADDTQLFLSFPPEDSTVSSRISACLSDISAWMSERHLQLNLSKTEVLVFPARPSMQHNISIKIGSTVIVPTKSVKNLGVIIDDQLSFKDHISSVSRAADFLSTTSGRSDPTSRNIQPNSLYRRWSHLVSITATLC
ncbi:hypothetical protein Q8A73_001766 [Channa argus]|nr:hypothetical protein Q8A73_001757 [Channa argus]KAK2922281.1 hypothetical protein Q8A73_001766 [Channa argus]